MPVARYQLEDGRVARFEVPEGTTPEQAQQIGVDFFAKQQEEPQPEEPSFFQENIAPVIAPLSEAASAANRGLLNMVQTLGVDPVNAALQLAGVEGQIPKLTETEIGKAIAGGGFLEPGIVRDVIQTGGELAAPGAAIGKFTRAVAGAIPAAQTVGSGIAQQLAQGTTRADVGFSALSGAGSRVGEEAGGAPGATVGGFVAPLSSEAVRRAFAGGTAGLKNLKASLIDFAEIGATPTVGTATGNRLQRGFENLSSKVLGGGAIRRSLDKVTEGMQNRLKVISDDLSSVKGDVEAGRVIQKGIKGEGGFVDRFLNKSGLLWKNFDKHIDDAAPVQASNTTRVLDDLVNDTDFGPILNNPLVARIKSTLDEAGGSIDYKSFRNLRSSIGERLGSNDLVSDIPRAQLKRLYGALSEDLTSLAAASGDDAVAALSRANRFTSAGHGRIDDFVERIAGKVDLDKIFQSIAKGGEGVQSINAIKRSLKPEEWEAVASNVIRRLGKATSGQQDDVGEVFSVNKFLTDWNKLGPAKKVLFSGSKNLNQYSNNLDRIASVADKFKSGLKEMANASGTGQFAVNVGILSGAGGALASGRLGTLGIILSGVAANTSAARLMSSPKFVKWLASTPKTNAAPHIATLADLAEETGEHEAIEELIEDLRQPDSQQ